jgi:ferredoxin
MLKITGSRLDELYSLINDNYDLYLPTDSSGNVRFDRWTPEAEVRLDQLITVESPKDLFFLSAEDIAAFKLDGKDIIIKDIRKNVEPFVVFGLRACDAASLNLLDKVFLSEPVDSFYQERRQNGIVITTSCSAPEETCFCEVFDINAANPGGDVTTWLIGEDLYWKSNSEKGDMLTGKVSGLFAPAEVKAVSEEQNRIKEILGKLPFKDIKLKGLRAEALLEKFESKQWEKLHHSCIACGTCTFICPTCHCYDVQDFDTGSEIRRLRCWDSCMNSDFTQMAHGNPRPTSLERFRQRYMHKLIYFPDSNGAYACVGCGRCVRNCPVSMNIVKVIKALEVEGNV